MEQLGKALGMARLAVVPNTSRQDDIQAVRLMFQRCYFDADAGSCCASDYSVQLTAARKA